MIALISFVLAAQNPPDATIQDYKFLLEGMVMADQEARNAMVFAMNNQDNARRGYYSKEMARIDEANLGRLKEMVYTWGWPTISVYGRQAAHHAWLLVQHADSDVKFQQKCLRLMEPLVPLGQVDGANFAYLYDRVARNTGKPQRYGTQLFFKDKKMILQETQDPKNLDKRRAAVGLMPIKEYLELAEAFYNRTK